MRATLFTIAALGLARAQANPPVAAVSSGAASSTASGAPAAGTTLPDIAGICLPRLSNGTIDGRAPCHQLLLQSIECLAFADDGGNVTAGGGTGSGNDDAASAVENIAQSVQNLFNGTLNQECVCKAGEVGTGYFENLAGCSECLRLHGIRKDWFPVQLVPEASSSYCALTSPTVNVASFLRHFAATVQTPDLGTSTVTDVLGTSTDISQYFTSTSVAAASTGSASSTVTSSTSSSSTSTGGVPAITQAPWGGVVVAGVLGVAALL